MGLKPEHKERLSTVYDILATTVRYGFVPLVVYLGFRKGAEPNMPPLTIFNLLWQ